MILAAEETVYAGSGIGLMARVLKTTDAYMYREDVASIAYEVFVDGASQSPAVTGSLTVATVMLTALTTWGKDSIGKTFHWDAPGTLWPTADTTYVVVCTFTPQSGDGEAFKVKWIINAVDSRDE
jgi:hypothetical protein